MALLIGLILAGVVVEGIVLASLQRRTGRGVPPRELIPTLLAGGALMLALCVAVAGGPRDAIYICLAAAGLAHVIDMRTRWRR